MTCGEVSAMIEEGGGHIYQAGKNRRLGWCHDGHDLWYLLYVLGKVRHPYQTGVGSR